MVSTPSSRPRPIRVSVTETALRLGVKSNHVTRLVESGELDAINVSTGQRRRGFRISVDSIDVFLENRRFVPSGDYPPAPISEAAPARPHEDEAGMLAAKSATCPECGIVASCTIVRAWPVFTTMKCTDCQHVWTIDSIPGHTAASSRSLKFKPLGLSTFARVGRQN